MSCTSLSCLDENGKPVDRWIDLKAHSSPSYFVFDDAKSTFNPSPYNTSETQNGNIMKTVQQLYDSNLDEENVAWGIYNDDPAGPGANPPGSIYAHAKGVLMVDGSSGT